MFIRTLSAQSDTELNERLRWVAEAEGLHGIFNPSLAWHDGKLMIAFRALRDGSETSIRSYLTRWDDACIETTDLSALGEEHGISRVADPKFFRIGHSLYLTFNTGYTRDGFNDIYIVAVSEVLGPLQRAVAAFTRQPVEKNWAFAPARNGSLIGIYRLHPYAEIRLVDGALGETGELHFALRIPEHADSASARGLSIGSQSIRSLRSEQHLLMAHEKVSFAKRRAYFGRAVTVRGLGSDTVSVHTSKTRLIHDVRSALPRHGIHNTNLLSATYFSGLANLEGQLFSSYGVNDTNYSIVRLQGEDLWT